MKIKSCDLFCGGGGWTEGLKQACDELDIDITAHICVNHWSAALKTHSSNHRYARHICDNLNAVVRQIGNAVPVNTAKALLKCLLEQTVCVEGIA